MLGLSLFELSFVVGGFSVLGGGLVYGFRLLSLIRKGL